MKKGFTLLELIAVIVVIGGIMLIVVPNAIDIYNSSRIKLFESTVEKLYDAAEVYKSRYELSNNAVVSNVVLNIQNHKFTHNELSIDGNLPESGTISFDELGNISVVAYNEGFCGEKLYSDSEVTVNNLKKEDCYLYNVRPYEIIAKDFSIDVGDNIDLADYAYLSRYDKRIDDATITYSSTPTFKYNVTGDYNIKYTATYNGNTYTKEIIIKNKDSTPPTLTVSEKNAYFKTNGTIVISVKENYKLDPNNVYKYYLSTSNTARSGGTWTDYKNGSPISVSGTNITRYLWVYPIKDQSGNANKNTGGKPYVIGTIVFDTTPPQCTKHITQNDLPTGVSITWSCTDANGIDGASSGSKSRLTSNFSVSVSDKSGNSTEVSVNVSTKWQYGIQRCVNCSAASAGGCIKCLSWGNVSSWSDSRPSYSCTTSSCTQIQTRMVYSAN